MDTLTLVLLIVAAICFAVAAFGLVATKFNLVAAGLLAWVLAELLPRLLK
jgi:hypothetical protein